LSVACFDTYHLPSTVNSRESLVTIFQHDKKSYGFIDCERFIGFEQHTRGAVIAGGASPLIELYRAENDVTLRASSIFVVSEKATFNHISLSNRYHGRRYACARKSQFPAPFGQGVVIPPSLGYLFAVT
jgi:hypothetical protein